MSLHFRDKKKRWPPSRPVQYILAGLLVVLALGVLGGWLFIRFVYTEPTPDNTTQDSSIEGVVEPGDVSYCLVIVEDIGYERFALVKTTPQETAVSVTPLSPLFETAEGELYTLLKKYGPAQTTQFVAQSLNVSNLHYMSFSITDVETFFTRLGENLQFTLPEEVAYKDENGATIRLKAETHKLTPNQITALLRYTQWEETDNETNLGAHLTAALVNQCLRTDKSLKGYFELISNTAVTDLRIDQFNAYRSSLEYLASHNEGAIATVAPFTRNDQKE